MFGALSELGFEIWIRKGCGLDQCFPSVFGIVAKLPRWKSSSILPYFCSGNPVVLCLRCIIAWKMLFSPSFCCENTTIGMPHFHGEKSSRVSCLVCYGTPAGFHAYVYGACQHAHARTSQSPSKHQTHWYVSHTRGNWCHLVTWIGMVTPRWLCTQYDMNMHL